MISPASLLAGPPELPAGYPSLLHRCPIALIRFALPDFYGITRPSPETIADTVSDNAASVQ
ncbi:MAG: hypothetical protein WCD00_06590 [Desulfuromonadaceae bacterium]